MAPPALLADCYAPRDLTLVATSRNHSLQEYYSAPGQPGAISSD
jgi:hypothetical protein